MTALLDEYCALRGWALALAHAKSGDAAMIAGYVGKSEALDEALTKFAFAYSEQKRTRLRGTSESSARGPRQSFQSRVSH